MITHSHSHNPDLISLKDYQHSGGITVARQFGPEALVPVGPLVEWMELGETLHGQITTSLLLSATQAMRKAEKIRRDKLDVDLLVETYKGKVPNAVHSPSMLAAASREAQGWIERVYNQGINLRLSMASRRLFVKSLWQEIQSRVDATNFEDQYDRLHYIASLSVDAFGNDRIAVQKQGIRLVDLFPTMNRVERYLSWRHKSLGDVDMILGAARTRIFDQSLATKTIRGPRIDLLVAEILRPVTKDHDKVMVIVERRTRLRRLQTCIALHLLNKYSYPNDEMVNTAMSSATIASIVFYNTAEHVDPINGAQMERTAREIVVAVSKERSQHEARMGKYK